jgi:Asp-tRNA(Asn)/Glu-tRNA(Gln) amidotransferase B subunit
MICRLNGNRYPNPNIGLEDAFDKELWFLIPFHIFCYEKNFPEYETNEEKLKQLQQEYQMIRDRLEELTQNSKLSEYIKYTLLDMSKRVLDGIAAKYEKVRKEVGTVMVGKVLEYEAKTILQEGRKEGRKDGKMEALVELVRDGLLSISEASRRLGMREEELKKYL